MSRSVAQKMGIKQGARAYFENLPEALGGALRLPVSRYL
jgi:hypothetical protein